MTSPICDILTLLSLLVIICLLRRTIEIFPSLLASLIRWKESINLFNSVKLSRDRNMIALSMIVPFCLVVTASNIYSPSFISGMGEDARFGITFGIFILYIILRVLLERIFLPKRRNAQMYRCACPHTLSSFCSQFSFCLFGEFYQLLMLTQISQKTQCFGYQGAFILYSH